MLRWSSTVVVIISKGIFTFGGSSALRLENVNDSKTAKKSEKSLVFISVIIKVRFQKYVDIFVL